MWTFDRPLKALAGRDVIELKLSHLKVAIVIANSDLSVYRLTRC